MTEGIHAKITADSSSFEGGMQRAEASAKKFQSAASTTQASLNKTSSSFGLARNSAQQFGYQIQDVAVQLGSGTNAAVVFAQQGSQIASIFGPGGAVIGAVIAIAGAIAGPFVASLGEAKDEVKSLIDELKGLETGLDDLTLAQRRFIESVNAPKIAALEQQINALSNEAESLIGILQSPIQDQDFIKRTTDRLIEVQAAADTARKSLADLQQQQGILGGTVESDTAKKRREEAEKEKKETEKRNADQLEAEARLQQQKAALRMALISQTSGLEIEAETLKHEKKLEIITEAFSGELEATFEHNKVLEEEQQRHEDAISSIINGSVQQRLILARDAEKMQQDMRKQTVNHAVGLLSVLGQKNKIAAIAAIAITKGLAIAETLAHSQTASMLAYSSQLIPGDPSSIARAEAARDYTLGLGYASAALIAATGLAQAAGGGNRGGGGGSAGGSGAGQAASPASENSIVSINLEGDNFSRRSVVGLIEQINEAVADGARINIA